MTTMRTLDPIVAPSPDASCVSEVLDGLASERDTVERCLLAAERPLALTQRVAWARARAGIPSRVIAVRNGDVWVDSVAVESHPSRALPGYRVLRAERVAPAIEPEDRAVALDALVALARGDRRVLRLHVELFGRDADARRREAALLVARGFRRAVRVRPYTSTVAVDLVPPEDAIFAALHATARRHIRAPAKRGYEVRTLTDPALAPRLEALYRESLERTGGRPVAQDWPAILRLSQAHPELSRVLGLIAPDGSGGESMLAFAWGCFNGDHAHYSLAGSTRAVRTVPLLYTLAWELMRWARRGGATWFDFGGVSDSTLEQRDALGGISDFKRMFGREVVDVAEEWVLEPHALSAAVASVLSGAAERLARARLRAVSRVAGPAADAPAVASSQESVSEPVSALKRTKRGALSMLRGAGLFSVQRDSRWRRSRLLILCYHGVSLDDEHCWDGALFVSPGHFETRLRTLRDGGYNVLALSDAYDRLSSGTLPERSVCLTFDDGNADFKLRAWPLLRRYGFPATVYLTSFYSELRRPVFNPFVQYVLWKSRRGTLAARPYTGGDEIWMLRTPEGRLAALRALVGHARSRRIPAIERAALAERLARDLGVDYDEVARSELLHLLSPADVRALAEEGVDFQLHTHRHRFPRDRTAFVREIVENRERTALWTGRTPEHFCYPAGVHRPDYPQWLAECGVRSATTLETGMASRRSDPFLLPRVVDTMRMAPIEFESWLTGVGELLPRTPTNAIGD